MLNTPVLFLIFNRPDVTKQVFEQIKKAQPRQLFIGADGPRKDKPTDRELCERSRQIVLKGIDWPCEVKTLLREENLGCKIAVSSAITWFFENAEEGIILEDDTLPDLTFFRFCEELLDKFRLHPRVMSIAGTNLMGKWKDRKQSYFFGHGGIWGWATWRRAWRQYDIKMAAWGEKDTKENIRFAFHTDEWYNYYEGMFELAYNGKFDTWDVQWLYSILNNGGLVINPSRNLVKNIGFGSGTHTHDTNTPLARLKTYPMRFPMIHPIESESIDVPFLIKMYGFITRRSKILEGLKRYIFRSKKMLFSDSK